MTKIKCPLSLQAAIFLHLQCPILCLSALPFFLAMGNTNTQALTISQALGACALSTEFLRGLKIFHYVLEISLKILFQHFQYRKTIHSFQAKLLHCFNQPATQYYIAYSNIMSCMGTQKFHACMYRCKRNVSPFYLLKQEPLSNADFLAKFQANVIIPFSQHSLKIGTNLKSVCAYNSV